MIDSRETIPSIKPDQVDVASYRRNARTDPPKQSNFNGFLVFVIALMAIIMGVGGFALYEVQQSLALSNKLLDQGQNNIRDSLSIFFDELSMTIILKSAVFDLPRANEIPFFSTAFLVSLIPAVSAR